MMNLICVDSIEKLHDFGFSRIVVAIGVFDGVHSGHRKLLSELMNLSAELNAEPVVVSFWPHPKSVLDPQNAPPVLVSLERKKELFLEAGIKALVNIPFTKEFAALPPEKFMADCLLSGMVKLCGVCVGAKWRFGANGVGDIALLWNFAEKHDFKLVPVEEFSIDGKVVSSTAVRAAIAQGDIETANRLLGRYYTLFGTVRHGQGIAGSVLGAPTANLELDSGIPPKFGVYAGIAGCDGKIFPAIAAIGLVPTFPGNRQIKVEVHLLDETAFSLYDKRLFFELHHFIREERRFDSADELKKQIVQDILDAKKILREEI